MSAALADAVRAAPPERLLPGRLASEGSRIPDRLSLVAGEPLGTGRWLSLLADDQGGRFAAPLVLSPDGARRAVPGDGAAEALVARLVVAPAAPESVFDWTVTGVANPSRGERAMGVDQTHESVVVGDAAVVKWAVEASPSPAPLLLPHLHEVGFTDVPTPWGFVECDGVLVAAVDGYLPDAVDGWTWCVDDLARGLARRRGTAPVASFPGRLGGLVGRLHAALATPSTLLPRPGGRAGRSTIAGWHARACDSLDGALAALDGPAGDRLRHRAHLARAVIDELLLVSDTPTIHVHGDLHVGQVLRWSGGCAVTDFDGNPVLPPDERLRPEPAARDVAGMLQALDHVARVAARTRAGVDASSVDGWIPDAQRDFLSAYLAALADGGARPWFDERLLAAFRVEQECRELAYAMTHLPRWRYVPEAALAALLSELSRHHLPIEE